MLASMALSRLRANMTLQTNPSMQPTAVRSTLRQAPYALSIVSLAVLLVVITVIDPPAYAWDFRALYAAGAQYLHLHTPYVSGTLAQLTTQENYVYPLPFATLFAPISLIPYSVAAGLFVVADAVLLLLTLRLLKVRDWRVYAVVAIGLPTATAVGLGTISPLLAFLLALLWRFRERDKVTAPVLAVLVLAKLFLWPVGLWLLLRRRFRAVAAAAIGSAAALFLSALPFGSGVLTHYVQLLKSVSALEGPTSFSLSSLGSALTGSSALGTALMIAVGAVLLYAMIRSARRGEDERIFRLSIVAALALSPIVWNHYLVLLFVPLALTRPRFSTAWIAGAWVMGGVVLDARTLAIVTAAVWVVILVQSGLLEDMAVHRSRRVRAAMPFASSIAVWVALVWFLIAAGSAVPGWGALTASSSRGSASGTATLRLLKSKNEICWTIVTRGLPARTRAEIIDTGLHRVLFDHPLQRGRSVGCAGYVGANNENIALPFKQETTHLSLTVTSLSGRRLLAGRIVSDLRHLRVPAPQSS
jgi:alpha-1,2-mannosyltransferase